LLDGQNSHAEALPTLFLPVEIKHREFKAKVLLGTIAARAGFQVYLGSKAAVDAMVFRRRQRSGIYFYKGGKPLDFLTKLLGKVEHFVVLDEEMGPAVQNLRTAYTMRIYRGTEHLVGRLFVVGRRHKDVLSEVRPELADKVEVTGWPRIDLWSRRYQHQYGDEVAALRHKYGRFLLFSSNFGVISKDVLDREVQHIRSVTATPGDAAIYEASMKGALEDFRAFIELAKRMDADPDFPKVVIRPHPSEDIAVWRQHLGRLKKIQLVYQGETGPWLQASKGLLHRGCTTAIQAHLGQVPPIFIVAGQHKPDSESLPFRLSHPGRDYDALRQLCIDALEGELAPKANDDFADEIFLPKEGAAERIVHSLQALQVQSDLPVRDALPLRVIRIGLGVARHWLGSLVRTKGRQGIRVRDRKLPGGLHGSEVKMVARKLGVDGGVSFCECDFNLVKIRPVQDASGGR